MGLTYYRAIRKRQSKRRRAIHEAALATLRILHSQEQNQFEMRCERPGCKHAKSKHNLPGGFTCGCLVVGCGCSGYFLGPPT